MTDGPRRDARPADLEIGGSLRAAKGRWSRPARTKTTASGDVETEELREREPERPKRGSTYRNVRRIWQFRAWVADAERRRRS